MATILPAGSELHGVVAQIYARQVVALSHEPVQAGRKVITNLPLNIDALVAIDPSYRDLVEVHECVASIG